MKHRTAFYFVSFFLAGFLFASADATGQTIGYRADESDSEPSERC